MQHLRRQLLPGFEHVVRQRDGNDAVFRNLDAVELRIVRHNPLQAVALLRPLKQLAQRRFDGIAISRNKSGHRDEILDAIRRGRREVHDHRAQLRQAGFPFQFEVDAEVAAERTIQRRAVHRHLIQLFSFNP
ncbi:hypothetical protein D3C76_44690 [compost metagenome]